MASFRDSDQVGENERWQSEQLKNKRGRVGREGWALCDYAESDVGGKELETLLAPLSLQAVLSVAACLFSIRFADFGVIVLGSFKSSLRFISEIQLHKLTD